MTRRKRLRLLIMFFAAAAAYMVYSMLQSGVQFSLFAIDFKPAERLLELTGAGGFWMFGKRKGFSAS